MRNADIPINRKKIVANLDLIGLFINPPVVLLLIILSEVELENR
jgi:hypothetical protein